VKSPLNILHLEDNPSDAKLIRAALETEGIACATTLVKTRVDFVAALEAGGIDLVLSDFSMPGFDGLSATEIVRNRWPGIPFIFVSGTLGEARAGTAIEDGAAGYVLKDDLVHLALAVRRALEEVIEDAGELEPMTKDHYLGMFCLPVDGRWQTEAQLIGQSQMGNRTDGVFRDLVDAGFCERKIVPILCDIADAQDFMPMYRTTWKMRRAYGERSVKIRIPVRSAWLNSRIQTKIVPETINKSRKHRAIGGVFSNREHADKAIQAFRELGLLEQDIHVVVSLYDKTRAGKILVNVHNVKHRAAVIDIFNVNHADDKLDGSRNIRHDLAGLTVGVAVGATAGGATGTVVGGPAGTIIGAATGAVVGGGAGAAVGKAKEHLK